MIAENDDVIKKKIKSFVCNSREEKLVYFVVTAQF